METFDFLVLSFRSSIGKKKIFSKKKNMEAVEVKLEDILLCEEMPIVRLLFLAFFHNKILLTF